MNNRNILFKSLFFTKFYVWLTGGKNIKQGPYKVVDLIHRFTNVSEPYTNRQLKEELVLVVNNYAKYGFHVDEYFIYDVKSLSDYGKSRFITEETRWKYYEKLNEKCKQEIFDDKDKTYEIFKEYYKRECIVIKSVEDKPIFDDFKARINKIILKPQSSSGGKGVRLFDSEKDTFEGLLQEYKSGFVAEEALENASEMAEFHEKSLNTVRIVTVRLDTRVEVACAFARFGTGGNCVDNFASKGIMGVIDVESGIIYSAIDKTGKRYIVHPDSKKTILGFEMPQWSELVQLVKELAQIVPTNRYTAWDMAYTRKGWAIVEINARGQFVAQMPAREGLKQKFEEYIAELE